MTSNSFYEGGRFGVSLPQAMDYAAKLINDGATILDIGGESTRPGSSQISHDEELFRVIPLIEALHQRFDIPLSIDTSKSKVAQKAIEAGAKIINDVSSGRFDTQMSAVVASLGVEVILMHSRQTPATMQKAPLYVEVLDEVTKELLKSVALFKEAGTASSKIILDPGIGFAKRVEDNMILLRHCSSLVDLGFPLLIGTSRKSFIGAITGSDSADRLGGSLATVGIAYEQGATLFRVHDVKATVDFLRMSDALMGDRS